MAQLVKSGPNIPAMNDDGLTLAAVNRRPQRTVAVLGAAIGSVLLAAVLVVAFGHPQAVLGILLVVAAAAALIRFPVAVLIVVLFVEPFNLAIFVASGNVAHVSLGPLVHWYDILIYALFARGLADRFRADRRLRLPREAGDRLLLLYVLVFILIATVSTHRSTLGAALNIDIQGPLLFLAIRFLRPSRQQLLLCATALIGAASVMGGAALIERAGPRINFQQWYGAPTAGVFLSGEHGYRSGSFLNSPLVLGFYLAGATPFAVAMTAVRSRWRPVALLSAVLCAGGLITTLTRSAYIGAGIGVLLVLLFTVPNPGVRLSLVGMVVVISGVAVLHFTSPGSDVLVRSVSTTAHRSALGHDVDLLLARPLGYGLGTTDRFAQQLGSPPGTITNTESTIMAYALEAGFEALVLYLVVLYVTGMRLRRRRVLAKRRHDPFGMALAAGALGALVGISLSGLFLGIHEQVVEVVLWGAPGIATAWAASGTGAAVRGNTADVAPALRA